MTIEFVCRNCAGLGRNPARKGDWNALEAHNPVILIHCNTCGVCETYTLDEHLIEEMLAAGAVASIKNGAVTGIYPDRDTPEEARETAGLQYDYLRPATRADIEYFFFPDNRFAIVPENGDGPVWGLGRTEEEAWADAEEWTDARAWEPDANEGEEWDDDLECRECTPALARMVMMYGGDVRWAFLKDGRVGTGEEKEEEEKEVSTH